jgi:meso-butanediol dehydrogenase/(S,S)-butanediol dehydrogenase/diacetyl reductase
MDRLKNKAALITGAGAGIGAATARLFCAQGARVCLLDANPQALRDTQAKLLAEFPQASVHTAQADIADEGQAQAAVQTAVAALGGLDVLVNNAAMRNYSALADATPAEWQAMVGVNLVGTATMSRWALPHLRVSGRGSIVNVSSAHALIGRKGMGLYDSTKAGMLAMTRTLAFEEVQHGVRVNAVCPGSTFTDGPLGRTARNGMADCVAGFGRSLLHHRRHLDGRWRFVHHVRPHACAWFEVSRVWHNGLAEMHFRRQHGATQLLFRLGPLGLCSVVSGLGPRDGAGCLHHARDPNGHGHRAQLHQCGHRTGPVWPSHPVAKPHHPLQRGL